MKILPIFLLADDKKKQQFADLKQSQRPSGFFSRKQSSLPRSVKKIKKFRRFRTLAHTAVLTNFSGLMLIHKIGSPFLDLLLC